MQVLVHVSTYQSSILVPHSQWNSGGSHHLFHLGCTKATLHHSISGGESCQMALVRSVPRKAQKRQMTPSN